jgi:two-component system nitrogen regulation sensor histidine kinase NtrY
VHPAAAILLGLPAAGLEGRNLLDELGRSDAMAPLVALWSESHLALRSGEAADPREISIRRNGDEARLRSVVLPLIEAGPGLTGRIYLVEDVTEVMRSNRLAAWAEMARRIAHEIKNPLTPIQLSAEHLLRVRSDGSADFDRTLHECVATILGQVSALREISSDFSAYSRLPDLHREPTDLAALVRATAAPYRSSPPPGIRVEEALAPVPSVLVDARVLRRALVNLIENALQAMDGGGTLGLALASEATPQGEVARIDVTDTGEGMSPETAARIFEPYFSTRDTGVGLGLAIARRAVEEHGGTITAESALGKGTCMTVRLPLRPPA